MAGRGDRSTRRVDSVWSVENIPVGYPAPANQANVHVYEASLNTSQCICYATGYIAYLSDIGALSLSLLMLRVFTAYNVDVFLLPLDCFASIAKLLDRASDLHSSYPRLR